VQNTKGVLFMAHPVDLGRQYVFNKWGHGQFPSWPPLGTFEVFCRTRPQNLRGRSFGGAYGASPDPVAGFKEKEGGRGK